MLEVLKEKFIQTGPKFVDDVCIYVYIAWFVKWETDNISFAWRWCSCKSCGQTSKHCPGHFGHIELVSPVYNPLMFNILSIILQRTCFSCHHFQATRHDVSKHVLIYDAVVLWIICALPKIYNTCVVHVVSCWFNSRWRCVRPSWSSSWKGILLGQKIWIQPSRRNSWIRVMTTMTTTANAVVLSNSEKIGPTFNSARQCLFWGSF